MATNDDEQYVPIKIPNVATYEQVAKLFRSLLDGVKQVKEDLIATNEKFLAAASDRLDAAKDRQWRQMQIDHAAALAEQERGMNFLRDKVRSIQDGKPGPKGDKGNPGPAGAPGRNGQDGRDGEDGEDGSPDTPDQVREKLETTLRSRGLSIDLIAGLQDELKKIREGNVVRPPAFFGPGRPVHVPMVDVFTGDGSTKTFYLTKQPRSLDTIKGWGSDFPFILTNGTGNGFTIAGKALTLDSQTDAPSSGARFVVEYYV